MSSEGDGTSIEQARDAIRALEPLFHRFASSPERREVEEMTSEDFWEVGASGSVYGREFVISTVLGRAPDPAESTWSVSDFSVRRMAPDLWLATYELDQHGRRSRRSTLWRSAGSTWKAEYHQGTLIGG